MILLDFSSMRTTAAYMHQQQDSSKDGDDATLYDA
jgi:hypothetical protein